MTTKKLCFLLLAVINLIHCQDDDWIVASFQAVMGKLEGISDRLKDVQKRLGNLETNFQEHHHELELVKGAAVKNHNSFQSAAVNIQDSLQNVQQRLGNLKTDFQEHHHEMELVKGAAVKNHNSLHSAAVNTQDYLQITTVNSKKSLQKLHHELENIKGAAVYNQDSLQKLHQTLEQVEAAAINNEETLQRGHQEIKSFVQEEISRVISLSETDECSEVIPPCGSSRICTDTLFSFTCSCPSGFNWDGLECTDIDECAEGKGACSPHAVCKNSIGSYSCSCNKPFHGDGRTSCEFHCRNPAKFIRGLGCLKYVTELMTFVQLSNFCQEEGGRLLQQFNGNHLTDIWKTFEYNHFLGTGWVGVLGEKWSRDGSLVPEDLWEEGCQSDPLKKCGILLWDSSSSSFKVTQKDCSGLRWGYCQFQLP